MADESALVDLLYRAGNVFSLAGKLGRPGSYQLACQPPIGTVFTLATQLGWASNVSMQSSWNRHAPAFDQFCQALLDLREPMQNPPDGFAAVAERLLEAARIAKGLRDALRRDEGRAFTAYRDFFHDLNSVAEAGGRAVREATKARWLDDPFVFMNEPGGATRRNNR